MCILEHTENGELYGGSVDPVMKVSWWHVLSCKEGGA
jgi:hypothetical protein